MKSINEIHNKNKESEFKYERYKKLVRNLRRGKVEKISSKKTGDNIPKE